MSIVHEGWVEKTGQSAWSNYKKRWLVLYNDKTMKYYEDNYYEILKGSVDISIASKVQNCNKHSKSWKFAFEVVTPQRNWQFSCPTDGARRLWIEKIDNVMSVSSFINKNNNNKAMTKNYNKHANTNNNNNNKSNLNKQKSLKDIQKSSQVTAPLINDNYNETKTSNENTMQYDSIRSESPNNARNDRTSNNNSNNINNSMFGGGGGDMRSMSDGDNIVDAIDPSYNYQRHASHDNASRFGGNLQSNNNVRLTRTSITEMVNSHISLSVKDIKARKRKQSEQRCKMDSIEMKFQCQAIQNEVDAFLNNSENSEKIEDHLICYCGERIMQSKSHCHQNVNCEFCGQHEINPDCDYYECTGGSNDTHVDGFLLCAWCTYHMLMNKYWNPSSGQARRVGVRIHVSRINNVDTAAQSFRAKFKIVHSWKPTQEEVTRFNASPTQFMPLWTPSFDFPNQIETHSFRFKQSHWGTDYTILKKGESLAEEISPVPYVITGELWIDATFSEVFELENFPVDCQDLTIQIQSLDFATICMFTTPFESKHMLTMLNEYSTIPEWTVHAPIFKTKIKSEGPVAEYSCISVSIKLARSPMAYFWRMILFMMLLSSTSLVAFALDAAEYGADRVSFLITLLLTAVAYQFAILNDLPNVSYLTIMDRYILQTFLFIFIMLIETAVVIVVGNNHGQEMSDDLDSYLSYVFWAVFILVQASFAMTVFRARVYELGKLNLCEDGMKQYCKKKCRIKKLVMSKLAKRDSKYDAINGITDGTDGIDNDNVEGNEGKTKKTETIEAIPENDDDDDDAYDDHALNK